MALGGTVNEIFKDFKGRRAAIIKALTTDVEEFYQQCDPARENLCLIGHPNGEWEVILPAEEVPPELPEPALGINFARDGMPQKDWLSLIAVHSDAWLLSSTFFFAAKNGFDKTKRDLLFNMMSELHTVFDIVTGKEQKEKSSSESSSSSSSSESSDSNSSSKSSSSNSEGVSQGLSLSDTDKDCDLICEDCDSKLSSG